MKALYIILFLPLLIIWGCKEDNCYHAVYYDLDTAQIFDNSVQDDSFIFNNTLHTEYKWIHNKDELFVFLNQYKLSMKSDSVNLSEFNFNQYSMLGIIYVEGCDNAKRHIEVCDNLTLVIEQEDTEFCNMGLMLTARLIQVPKGEYRILFYGETI